MILDFICNPFTIDRLRVRYGIYIIFVVEYRVQFLPGIPAIRDLQG